MACRSCWASAARMACAIAAEVLSAIRVTLTQRAYWGMANAVEGLYLARPPVDYVQRVLLCERGDRGYVCLLIYPWGRQGAQQRAGLWQPTESLMCVSPRACHAHTGYPAYNNSHNKWLYHPLPEGYDTVEAQDKASGASPHRRGILPWEGGVWA